MHAHLARAAVLLTLIAGMFVVAPAAHATKVLERWKGTVKELKTECADQGGSFIGSKSGKNGVCVWDDGSFSSCSNGKKGKNCNTQGRVVTENGEFLDLVAVGLADPSSVTVVPTGPDATGARKQIRGLLADEDFSMSMPDLERVCSKLPSAALIQQSDGSLGACVGVSVTVFCADQQQEENCTIEATPKRARKVMQLLRRAFLDPSSLTIVRRHIDVAPPPPASTTTTTPPSTSTSTSTTTTTGPFLT